MSTKCTDDTNDCDECTYNCEDNCDDTEDDDDEIENCYKLCEDKCSDKCEEDGGGISEYRWILQVRTCLCPNATFLVKLNNTINSNKPRCCGHSTEISEPCTNQTSQVVSTKYIEDLQNDNRKCEIFDVPSPTSLALDSQSENKTNQLEDGETPNDLEANSYCYAPSWHWEDSDARNIDNSHMHKATDNFKKLLTMKLFKNCRKLPCNGERPCIR